MPSEDNNIIGFSQYQKSDKPSSVISADLQSITKTMGGFKNDPGKLSTTKLVKHIPLDVMSSMSSIKDIKNKQDLRRGK